MESTPGQLHMEDEMADSKTTRHQLHEKDKFLSKGNEQQIYKGSQQEPKANKKKTRRQECHTDADCSKGVVQLLDGH